MTLFISLQLVSTTVDDDGKKASEKDVAACLVFKVNKYLKTLIYIELKYLYNGVCCVHYRFVKLILTQTQLKLVKIGLYSRLLASQFLKLFNFKLTKLRCY